MRNKGFLAALLIIYIMETVAVIIYANVAGGSDNARDAVLINEAVRSAEADFKNLDRHVNRTELNYVVLDMEGNVLFRTKTGLSESINMAVIHGDTILDIKDGSSIAGKIIIYNDGEHIIERKVRAVSIALAVAMLAQAVICIIYIVYLNRTVIKPFDKLKDFAKRVAGGNLDIPIEMDRKNLFGAFTESFDIMRCEIKEARLAQAEADAAKKELVAKLSHDIKTPVASIKAASEVGAALADDEKIRDNYARIIRKADQINSLITNLFTATLEELRQLTVTPEDIKSPELKNMLKNADYLHKVDDIDVPDYILYADKLRLQQVFDNIFANSYKYAGTKINVNVKKIETGLAVSIEDYGGGVSEKDLPLIKEKFKRGCNAKDIEGAGLGLYISDYFMKEMKGALDVENGKNGLKVTVMIALSGRV